MFKIIAITFLGIIVLIPWYLLIYDYFKYKKMVKENPNADVILR